MYLFHPAAETEHLETIAFYQSKGHKIAIGYFAEFESIVQSICDNPQRYTIDIAPDIRRKRFNKYPFTLYFRYKNKQVQILAVAHHRQRPQYWLART